MGRPSVGRYSQCASVATVASGTAAYRAALEFGENNFVKPIADMTKVSKEGKLIAIGKAAIANDKLAA